MKKKSGVYQIRNLINDKKYIGQSVNLHERKLNHFSYLKNNNHSNSYLQNAYNKHGKENFIFEILIYCECFELTKYEQFFVDLYKGKGILYNLHIKCVDSNKGLVHSEEAKRRIGIASKARGFSDEHRAKISRANSGKNHAMWGKHHTEEAKKKISDANKGRVISIKHRKKISDYQKGRPCSEKTKKILSDARKGKKRSKKDIRSMVEAKGITLDKILLIRSLLESNMKIYEIEKTACVSRPTVYKVKNGNYNDIFDL